MVTLVLGGSGSGKSAIAESMLEEIKDVEVKYYLATMQVYDEDAQRKVNRHRELRRGKGFRTIEQPRDIFQALDQMDPSRLGESAVLLECMSNLAANEMFGKDVRPADEVVRNIVQGIRILRNRVRHLIIVSNNVFEDGVRYDPATTAYMDALGKINCVLASESDEVTEVVAGIPVILKKERGKK